MPLVVSRACATCVYVWPVIHILKTTLYRRFSFMCVFLVIYSLCPACARSLASAA